MKDSINPESFSIEDSEELISQIKAGDGIASGPLHAALSELSHVADLPKNAIPPILPSGIKEVIYKMPAEFSKTRTAVVSFMAVALLASATLTAAAVTNTGPAELVRVAHETAKFVKQFAGTVTKAVTGSSKNPTPSQSTAATPSPTPSQSPSQSTAPTASATPTHTTTTPASAVVVPTKAPTPEHSEKPSPAPTRNEETETPSPTPTKPFTGLTPPPVASGGGGESDDHEGSSTRAPRPTRSPSAGSTQKTESNSEKDD